jgi:hypothetical protein
MRTARTILIVLLAAVLAGCVVGAKQRTAQNIPPPPQPAAKPEPPAPAPTPLSITQTQVELPPPQTPNPDALAAAQAPEDTTEPPSAPHTTGGTRRGMAGPPPISPSRTEPAAAAPAVTTPSTPPPEASPRIQEIIPPNEQKHLQELADTRNRETRQLLEQASARKLNHRETGIKKTIESYLKLADQAEAKGDMRQAADFADRALTLAKDLQSGR